MYLVLQTALWWLFHMTIFFWKIHFPFHARSFELSNNMTCIKILTFTVCMLVPLVSVITPMATFATDLTSDPLKQKKNITFLSGGLGFRIIRFPPVLCLGGNDDAVYYSTLLPINIVVFIGITELIFIFYAIHKVITRVVTCHFWCWPQWPLYLLHGVWYISYVQELIKDPNKDTWDGPHSREIAMSSIWKSYV